MQKFVTTGRAQSKDSLLDIIELSDKGKTVFKINI